MHSAKIKAWAHCVCRCIPPRTNNRIFLDQRTAGSMEKFSSELPFSILLMADPQEMEVDTHFYPVGICWHFGGSREKGGRAECLCLLCTAEHLLMHNQSFSHLANCPGPWLGGCDLHNHYPGTGSVCMPCSGNQPLLTQSGICIIPLQLLPSSFTLDMQSPPFSLAAAIPLCLCCFSFNMFSSNKDISFAPDVHSREKKGENTLKSWHRLVFPVTSPSISFWSYL